MSEQDRGGTDGHPTSADGVTERDPSIPASEEGTGIVPEDTGGGAEAGTHLPASEADTALVEGEEGSVPQSWPGRGPGSIPPPG